MVGVPDHHCISYDTSFRLPSLEQQKHWKNWLDVGAQKSVCRKVLQEESSVHSDANVEEHIYGQPQPTTATPTLSTYHNISHKKVQCLSDTIITYTVGLHLSVSQTPKIQ